MVAIESVHLAEGVVQSGVERAATDEQGERGNRLARFQLRDLGRQGAQILRFQCQSNVNGMPRLLAFREEAVDLLGGRAHEAERLLVAQHARGKGPDVAERHAAEAGRALAGARLDGELH